MQLIHTPHVTAADIIEAFIKDHASKDSSKQLYSRTLRRYLQWLDTKAYQAGTVTRAQILEYKDELLASGCSPLTVASYLTVTREFYNWAEANRYIIQNPTKGKLNLPKKAAAFLKETLTETETDQLNEYAEQHYSARDFAIINLMQYTGLRCIEVVRANIEDIKIKNGCRVLEIQGKGRDSKDEAVTLFDEAYKPLLAYLNTRPKAKTGEPLFISNSNRNTGQRLTTRHISGIVKNALRNIGLDSRSHTAHSLRHTVGTTIFEMTQDLNKVQAALRHRNPATSQIYARKAMQTAAIQNSPLALISIRRTA